MTRPATPWPPRPPCRPPFGRSWAAATAATRCGRRERKRGGGGGEGQPAAAASAETDPSRRPDPSPHQPLFLFSPHRKRRSWWASRSRSCARPPRSKRSPLTGAATSTTAGSRPWRTRPGRAACSFERAGGAVRGGGRAPLVCVLFFPFFLHSLDRWVSVCRVCERERESERGDGGGNGVGTNGKHTQKKLWGGRVVFSRFHSFISIAFTPRKQPPSL